MMEKEKFFVYILQSMKDFSFYVVQCNGWRPNNFCAFDVVTEAISSGCIFFIIASFSATYLI